MYFVTLNFELVVLFSTNTLYKGQRKLVQSLVPCVFVQLTFVNCEDVSVTKASDN